jgi:mannose-6-phosphate isomerase-like protein (cupin superfamily)
MRALLSLVLMLVLCSVVRGDQTPASRTAAPDDPAGFVLWKSAAVTAAADRLDQKIGKGRLMFETIGNYPGHSIYLVLRGATGEAEFHETESDLFVARRGRATLVIGGELVNPEMRPRRQQRAKEIKGGVRRELLPGDIAHIPMATPHQLLIAPGERFMYDLIKFDEEPLSRKGE